MIKIMTMILIRDYETIMIIFKIITSWGCTGPSSAQAGTGTFIYFIQDLLR